MQNQTRHNALIFHKFSRWNSWKDQCNLLIISLNRAQYHCQFNSLHFLPVFRKQIMAFLVRSLKWKPTLYNKCFKNVALAHEWCFVQIHTAVTYQWKLGRPIISLAGPLRYILFYYCGLRRGCITIVVPKMILWYSFGGGRRGSITFFPRIRFFHRDLLVKQDFPLLSLEGLSAPKRLFQNGLPFSLFTLFYLFQTNNSLPPVLFTTLWYFPPLKPVLNWTNICFPNLVQGVQRTWKKFGKLSSSRT